jgi:crotonobetainyl-CoA:carnitine CoA-transferase CaiB-like acyl-CoA transferase
MLRSLLRMKSFPLEGIRVTEIGAVIMAPYLCQLFGWMGAEVIKIENTERLDFGRRAGSFPPGREGDPNCSAYFGANNCSKKSCLLDLSKPRARELAKEIIRRSDVFVEKFAPGHHQGIPVWHGADWP